MTRKLLALSGLSIAFAFQAEATISFNIQGDLLTDQNGAPIPQGALVLFVASTENATFEAIKEGGSTAVGGALSPGGDDYVVFRITSLGSGVDGVLDKATGGLSLNAAPNWTPGDPLAIVWFPSLNASASLLSANTRYGIYSNPALQDGSRQWITPTDPTSNYGLALLTTNGDTLGPGTNPATAGRSSQSVAAVPEPGTIGLLGLGLAGLAARRRRK